MKKGFEFQRRWSPNSPMIDIGSNRGKINTEKVIERRNKRVNKIAGYRDDLDGSIHGLDRFYGATILGATAQLAR